MHIIIKINYKMKINKHINMNVKNEEEKERLATTLRRFLVNYDFQYPCDLVRRRI